MRARRRTAAAVVALLAGAAIVLLWGRTRPPTRDDELTETQGATTDTAPTARTSEGVLAAEPAAQRSEQPAGTSSAKESSVDPKTTIEGRVIGVDGKPAARVCLTAYDVDPRALGGPFREWQIAVTDESGRFRLLGLVPRHGLTTAWIVPEKRQGATAPVVAAPIGATDVEVRLLAVPAAWVRVVDERGVGIKNILVQSWRAGARVSDVTGQDGLARIELDEDFIGAKGSPNLVAVPRGRNSDDWLETRLADWDLRDVTLRMRKTCAVEGVVQDLAGRPVARAIVRVQVVEVDAVHDVDMAETDSAGRFRLTRFAADAQLRLGARTREAPDVAMRPGARTFRAGDTGIVLTIDAGVPLHVALDDWPKGAIARATLTREGVDMTDWQWVAALATDGTLGFGGVPAASTYTLWIPPPAGENVCVFEQGLRPGRDPIRVTARPARTIVVRWEAVDKTPVDVHSVSAEPLGVEGSRDDERGCASLIGVPAWRSVRVVVVAEAPEELNYYGERDVPPDVTEVTIPLRRR